MASTTAKAKPPNHDSDRKRSNVMVGKSIVGANAQTGRDTGGLNPVKVNTLASDTGSVYGGQQANPLSKALGAVASAPVAQTLLNQIYQMSKQTSGERRPDINFPSTAEIEAFQAQLSSDRIKSLN